MAIMPGAIYRPVPLKGRGKRAKGRGICLHVAVSEAASLFGYFSTASADSHFYVRKDGTIEQYVDTDFVAYANAAGNRTLISVETQGGVKNPDGEPWTPQQVAAQARIIAWSAALDGYPIQLMPDSKATSRGVGYHRLGCKPNVVAGGELWSSAYGKVCPGTAKIAQIPEIIFAAVTGGVSLIPVQEDDMFQPIDSARLSNVEAIASDTRNLVVTQVGRLSEQVHALAQMVEALAVAGGTSADATTARLAAQETVRALGAKLAAS